MIYFFTGNSQYLVSQQVQKWKQAFIQKYGEENTTHISQLDSNSKNTISELLVSRSLFAEKRLIIIGGFPFSGEKGFSGATELEELILKLLSEVPEEVLVVFASSNPDKRKKGYKTLVSLAETKQFNIAGNAELLQILSSKYKAVIEPVALSRIIFLKGGDMQKCISEIEKLLIAPRTGDNRGDYKIIASDVDKYISPEFEESIFVFIDTLTSRNGKKIFSELNNLIESSNLYAIYQSIIANLRIFLYIELLKSQRVPERKISGILKLGNRSFLINKRHASKISSLKSLYEGLLSFDKNMKFGKFTSSDPADMHRELENVFVKFLA